MRILSIDVGIKNLAHCLFETEPFSILDWAVLDLSDMAFCACKKPAVFIGSNGEHCCKKHAPKNVVTARKSVEELKQMCAERQFPTEGSRKELVTRLKLQKVKGAMQIHDVTLSKNLTGKYNEQFQGHRVDVVLIENQMAPRMKPLQGMLIQYWTMHGASVEIISPANKLKALNMVGTTYAQRKKLSIEHTRRILGERGIDATAFESKRKKDDLADSFLQGDWYIRNVKMRTT